MEFINEPYQLGETIAAVATPPGEGGVAIVRISGDQALEVASRVFKGPVHSYVSHSVHAGHVLNAAGLIIDHVLLLVMKGKRSFTGENTVEIHCHGGNLITRRVLDAVLYAGARAARPGEFTFKAFMNGKLDLSQAEAIQELICAKNERALDAAENQLHGMLSKKIEGFQNDLINAAAILEAWVDFPEEGLEFASLAEISQMIEEVCLRMEHLAHTFHNGRILHDGISLCLIGCPNVGKSSLMNAFLDKDRAIVSSIPGTTRDVLEDQMRLNGLNFRLIDTAGIRQADDDIEKEGIRRSQVAMKEADLILVVFDASRGLEEEDFRLIQQIPQHKAIAIWNKTDLPHPNPLPFLDFPRIVSVSATSRQGLDELFRQIDEVIWEKGPPSKEEVLITNVRHKEALNEAIKAARSLLEGLKHEVSPEFLSMDMRLCLSELGKIIGSNITEDVLTAIFSKFCIGK
jgi:tRNA modification GTPase